MAFDNFNTGNFGSGLVSGLTQGLGYGQQQRTHKLARDRFDLDETKFDEQVRQYDEQYKLQQDNYKLNKTQTDLNVDANTRAQELQPGALEFQTLRNTGQGLTNTQLDLTNQQTQIDLTKESNDIWIGNATAGDLQTAWITPDEPTRLNRENSLRNVIAGGRENDFLIIDTFNRDTDLPPGFKYDRLVRKDGSLAISGTYTSGPKKGQKGVLTEDGGIGDDAQIAALSPEMVVGLMDGEYTTNIRGASEGGKSSWVVQYKVGNYVNQGVPQEEAEARAVDEVNTDTATATLQTQVQGEVDRASVDPETGEKDVRMSRTFRSILASAETDTEKLGILIDQAETMGIEVPDILRTALQRGSVDASQRQMGTTPGATGQAPIAEYDDTPSGVPRRTATSTNKSSTGYGPVDVKRELADLDSQIAKAEQMVSRLPGSAKARASQAAHVEELKAQRAALLGTEAGGLSDIQNQSAEVKKAAQALETGIFAGLDAMSPEEIEQKVTSGELQTTPQDEANLAAVLQEAEIESPADIPVKLPPKAQIAAYTWLMTIAPDSSARENIRKELHNLRSGSGRIDASRFDLEKQASVDMNAETSRMQGRTGQLTAATGASNAQRGWATLSKEIDANSFAVYEKEQARVEGVLEELNKSVYVLDDKGDPTGALDYDEARFAKGLNVAVGTLQSRLESLKGIGNKAAYDQIRSALNRTYSIAIQTMAESEEYGSWTDILADGEIKFIDGADEFMSRVYVESRDEEGAPKTFAIRSLSSGLKVEETIPASVVKNMFGNKGYTDFRRQLGTFEAYRQGQSAAAK
jgi:hypothetical protein